MVQQNLFNNTPEEREQLFIGLYKKSFPAVAKYVSKKGGSFHDAKDVFQDALVIYYEKWVNAAIEPALNQQAYLVGIAKNLWLAKFRKDLFLTPLDSVLAVDDFLADDELQPSATKLIHYLETAGQKCMDILRAFYYDKLPVDKIAGIFGYASTHSATVQKYKCMEKVRETVKQKSLSYADFIE